MINQVVSANVLDWLLEPENPSLRYRTLVELLDLSSNDEKVKEAQSKIINSNDVKRIFDKMHPDGYWLQKNSRTNKIVGDGVEYGSFATTHFILSYLAELGLTKENPTISKAAERYLNLQSHDGDWWLHMSCLIGYNIHTFIKFGYANDDRIKRAINYLLNKKLPDGGYLCDMHEKKYKTKLPKSCIRGSVKALLAFSLLPQFHHHERVKELVHYFLKRNGIYKSSDHTKFANKDMFTFTFPIIWGANSWEILLALSRMGYGNHKSLNNAWEFIESKVNGEGTLLLDYTPGQSLWKVGKKGEENKWLTFYMILAKKHKIIV